MIDKEEFLKLYPKYLEGQCTPEETELIESYEDHITMPEDSWSGSSQEKERLRVILFSKIHQSIGLPKKEIKYSLSPLYKIAAGLILVAGISFCFWRLNNQHPIQKQQANITTPRKILPGGNKAYLTMANGSVISLNELSSGPLETQAGAHLNKVRNGLLQYNQTDKPALTQIGYNQLTTPRGGQYQVQLADGTNVWLNAASTLKYPTLFNGQERKVELSGEAYFEVAKDSSKPFIVHLNGLDIKVLGTHFNVMGYAEENVVKTTLLKGSVILLSKGQSTLLKPGQQGSLNQERAGFRVYNVDVDDVVAWKNGFFVFDNEDIQTIMNKIARWYDVDVIFPKQFQRKNFGGTISRFNNVSQVLRSLELTGSVHFKVEGRRILVMQ